MALVWGFGHYHCYYCCHLSWSWYSLWAVNRVYSITTSTFSFHHIEVKDWPGTVILVLVLIRQSQWVGKLNWEIEKKNKGRRKYSTYHDRLTRPRVKHQF